MYQNSCIHNQQLSDSISRLALQKIVGIESFVIFYIRGRLYHNRW